MTYQWYRSFYGLQGWQTVEPLYLDKNVQVTDENKFTFDLEVANPLKINYKWYTKSDINNRLPNWFVFQKVQNFH